MAEKTVVLKRQPGERLGCRFLPAFGGCVLGPLRQGSPAARAGLEAFAGWQVTHVNDVRVTEPRQIRQIVQDAGEGIAFRLAPMSSPVGMPAFLSNHPALAAAVQRGEIDSSAPEHALESLYDIASQNGGAAWCTESVKQALEDWHRVRSKKPAPPVSEPDFSRGDIVEAVLTGAQHKELQGVRGRIRDIVDNRAHIKFFIDGTKLKSVKLSRLRLIEKADEGPGAKRRRTGPQDAQDSGSPASDPPQRAAQGANEGGSVSTDLPQQRATEGANEGGSVKKSQQRATEGANEGGSVEKSSDLPQRATEGANGGSVKKSPDLPEQRAQESNAENGSATSSVSWESLTPRGFLDLGASPEERVRRLTECMAHEQFVGAHFRMLDLDVSSDSIPARYPVLCRSCGAKAFVSDPVPGAKLHCKSCGDKTVLTSEAQDKSIARV